MTYGKNETYRNKNRMARNSETNLHFVFHRPKLQKSSTKQKICL